MVLLELVEILLNLVLAKYPIWNCLYLLLVYRRKTIPMYSFGTFRILCWKYKYADFIVILFFFKYIRLDFEMREHIHLQHYSRTYFSLNRNCFYWYLFSIISSNILYFKNFYCMTFFSYSSHRLLRRLFINRLRITR